MGDYVTKLAVVIDPVLEHVTRDLNLLQEMGLKVTQLVMLSEMKTSLTFSLLLNIHKQPQYVMNTHVHADHVTGSGVMKSHIQGLKSVISESSRAKGDILVKEGDLISVGEEIRLRVLETPGNHAIQH